MTADAILDLSVPLPSNWCPYKRQFGFKLWQIGWVPHSVEGRVWSDVSIVKDLSRIESKLQELERGTVRFLSLRSFKGSMALLTPWFQTSSPQLCEKWWCGSEDAISRIFKTYYTDERWTIAKAINSVHILLTGGVKQGLSCYPSA